MPLTLADVILAVRDLLNEASPAYFTDAEITRWIQQGTLDISSVAQCIEATASLTMVNNTTNYTVATDCVKVQHAEWATTRQAMRKITPSLLGEASTTLTADQPLRWFEFAGKLWVEPTPNTTAAAKTILYYYAKASNDVTTLPDSYQILAIWFATAMGKAKDKRYTEMATLYSLYANALTFRRVDVNQREPHTEADVKFASQAMMVGGGQQRG